MGNKSLFITVSDCFVVVVKIIFYWSRRFYRQGLWMFVYSRYLGEALRGREKHPIRDFINIVKKIEMLRKIFLIGTVFTKNGFLV